MSGFVENIRQIGIFMIAAQAVIHLAPEKQYEKYVKMIASVMILLLFVSPFLGDSGEIQEKWQEEIDRMEQEVWEWEIEGEKLSRNYAGSGSYHLLIDDIEEELKDRLGGLDACEGYEVTEVSLQFSSEETQSPGAGKANEGLSIEKLYVTVRDTQPGAGQESSNTGVTGAASDKTGSIAIEKVQVDRVEIGSSRAGGQEGQEKQEAVSALRAAFSGELGIDEECVEVKLSEE